ncbi:DUF4115 domain-containing protein [Xylophilus sp. Kf1]|nr:DUF4115 domain-containing protein [Xylophilus sp. Kf1]
MSETDQAMPGGQSGAGAMLRDAREAAGVHIAALAVALKVPVARLEALEAERFDLLPDPPFVRALAGSICRALKIDAAPVLALLPQKIPAKLSTQDARPDVGTFRTTSVSTAGLASLGGGMRHPVVWVVLVLLLAAAGLMFVPSERLVEWVQALGGQSATTAVREPVGGATDNAPVSNDPPVAAVVPMGPESTRGPATNAGRPDASSALVLTPSAGVMPAAPVTGAGAGAGAEATAAPTSGGLISFASTDASWVRVADSRGATVFEKIIKPGVPLSATGTPPLTVVVGNARATTVQVRGQAFDLGAITRNNVARFEVR